ncbi:MAG: ParA family protein [Methanosarcina sp.]
MNKIISVINPKGGSAKTTTAVNLAAGLAIRNKKVLFVDNDPSGDGSAHLLPEDIKVGDNITSLYNSTIQENYEHSLREYTYQSIVHGLDIVPADISLVSLDLEIDNDPNRNILLKKAINHRTTSDYDYVIIDTPPSIGRYLFNSLAVADRVIIPVSEYLSIKEISNYQYLIKCFSRDYNPNLKIDSIIMTMVDENATMFKDLREITEDIFGDKVCKTSIPRSVKFSEAPSYNQCIYDYAPESRAAVQHMKLVDELLEKWEREAETEFSKPNVKVVEDIDDVFLMAKSLHRKRKENIVFLGATISEKNMRYIDTVMKMMGTTNKSKAVKFILEEYWASHGKEVNKQARKASKNC